MQYLGFFLLQTTAPSAQTNPLMSFLPLIFIVAIFYFLVFMPMQKQKKQQAQMLSNLQTGTDVLTTGGIVGTIISISDTTLVLRVKPDNIKLQVMRSAVSSLVDTKTAIEEKK
jgi:preprotein translocase subunit YajC